MSKQKGVFSTEFKHQVLQLYENGEAKTRIVREFNLNASTLERWIIKSQRQRSCGQEKTISDQNEKEQLRSLRSENQRLKMENYILKRATLIIGREQR
ncbi:transposase [Paenibacillus sp. 1011MAR3C5]|uniref:transposase n=1 Tax=Paenibacillus sp. 1011MAR3C5 TaxID=1675787 RepID=UPI000E6BA698|nr:transposase [Paenibacillus sp. 1011MAR3C5]RJE85191.1 transposase [Paenibacillus sp. 1011MAR3C5]